MKKTFLGLVIFASTIFANAFSQERTCGTMPAFKIQNKDNVLSDLISDLHKVSYNSNKTNAGEKTIPVVIHVLYNTPIQKINRSQIASQMRVLNEDFAKQTNTNGFNSNPVGADTKIRFQLAITDPAGNPTNGIIYKTTNVLSFNGDDNDPQARPKSNKGGGNNAWDLKKYLNIWVCNLSGGLLGYSSLPGFVDSIDGVVLNYRYFGAEGTATEPFALGRTASHELGHYFGLLHIWGDDGSSCDGTDEIGDTPNQADETTGCPNTTRISCNNGPEGDMYQNYMDYTDDACMNIFTNGQANVMNNVLTQNRNMLLLSNGLTSSISNDLALVEVVLPRKTCDNILTMKAIVQNTGNNTLISGNANFMVNDSNITRSTKTLLPNQKDTITLLEDFNINTFGLNYTVFLNNNDNFKPNDSISFKISKSNTNAPTASFTISDTLVMLESLDSIIFTNTSSINATKYEWDMGDGTTFGTKNVKYKYKNAGIYKVMLKAANNFGCADTITKIVVVKGASSRYFNKFYNHPFKTTTAIEMSKLDANKTYTYQFYNTIGRLLYTHNQSGNSSQVNINTALLEKGNIFVKLLDGNKALENSHFVVVE